MNLQTADAMLALAEELEGANRVLEQGRLLGLLRRAVVLILRTLASQGAE